jgi:hypothetical protein
MCIQIWCIYMYMYAHVYMCMYVCNDVMNVYMYVRMFVTWCITCKTFICHRTHVQRTRNTAFKKQKAFWLYWQSFCSTRTELFYLPNIRTTHKKTQHSRNKKPFGCTDKAYRVVLFIPNIRTTHKKKEPFGYTNKAFGTHTELIWRIKHTCKWFLLHGTDAQLTRRKSR